MLGRELYEKSWLAQNKPYWLYNVLNRYDLAAQPWIQRSDKVGQARSAYNRTKKLRAAGGSSGTDYPWRGCERDPFTLA